MSTELTVHFVHTDSMGYGRMGTRLFETLPKIGVNAVDGQDVEGPQQATNAATWFSVPSHARWWWEGQHTSILTMIESTRIPEGILEGLDNFETVMVPSAQNAEVFSEHHGNVHVVHLGVDEQWTFRPRQDPDMFFYFLCGGSGPRKGVDLVTKAFAKVFGDFHGDGPIPRLIMKSPRGAESFDVTGDIDLVAGKLTNQEEVDLYARAHCYVQPSRGEGFGLQPLQAIAQGMPTILTDAHGHQAFAHLGYGISAGLSKAGYFAQGYAGDWWEPNFDELCDRMRWVYDNYTDATEFAATASQVAREQFTWENSARRLVEAIGPDVLAQPYAGSGEQKKAELLLFRVIVNKPWKAEIGGTHYLFEPGVVYHEPADVLRILFDGGLLDPSCLDDKGLSKTQVERLGTYSASHSHCYACGHLANDGPTYADYLFHKREVERLKALLNERELV